MTDTREACEKAFAIYSPFKYSIYKSTDVKRDTSHATSVFNHFTSGWQACEAHYKERIAELEKEKESMRDCINAIEKLDYKCTWTDIYKEIDRFKNIDQAIAESKP